METGLSKTLSYLLRHSPGDAGLDVDEQGFVPIDELLDAVRSRGWEQLNREGFIERLDDPEVQRFERHGTVVRATYGHSIEVDLDYPEIDPAFPLYHGTSPDAWSSVREDGLKPMSRQYVHLSRTIDEAQRVGQRHCNDPVLLEIIPAETGNPSFYRAGPVVLTDYLPPEWLSKYKDG